MACDFSDYKLAKDWQGSEHIPAKPGIYAVFLKTTDHVPEENTAPVPEDWRDDLKRPDHLLYIGRSADVKNGLKGRLEMHFFKNSSTADTFRRSLGLILKFRPVKAGKSRWRFCDTSEQTLTEWIQKNCQYIFCEADPDDAASDEIRLIVKHTPPLNINCNPEKNKRLIQARKDAKASLCT